MKHEEMTLDICFNNPIYMKDKDKDKRNGSNDKSPQPEPCMY